MSPLYRRLLRSAIEIAVVVPLVLLQVAIERVLGSDDWSRDEDYTRTTSPSPPPYSTGA